MQFETDVKSGKVLLVAQGTPDEVDRASEILQQTHAQIASVHAAQTEVAAYMRLD